MIGTGRVPYRSSFFEAKEQLCNMHPSDCHICKDIFSITRAHSLGVVSFRHTASSWHEKLSKSLGVLFWSF